MHPEGRVPQELTLPITPYRVAMRGTECRPSRCVALEGQVGEAVRCGIYTQRPSTCREFDVDDPRCNEVRARFGLPPLSGYPLAA